MKIMFAIVAIFVIILVASLNRPFGALLNGLLTLTWLGSMLMVLFLIIRGILFGG